MKYFKMVQEGLDFKILLFLILNFIGRSNQIPNFHQNPKFSIKQEILNLIKTIKFFDQSESFIFYQNGDKNWFSKDSEFSNFSKPYSFQSYNSTLPIPQYFNHEFTLERIISLKIFGTFRYIFQSSVIIIEGSGNLEHLTETILDQKFGQPTLDLYIYISNLNTKNDHLIVENFLNSKFAWYITNKIVLQFGTKGGEIKVTNPCQELYENGFCSKSITNGRNLIVRGNQGAPYFRFDSDGTNPSGMENDLLDIISIKYNFTTKRYYGRGSGTRFKNGTWINVVGEILYGRCDIGASVALNLDRFRAIDYTQVNVNLERIFLIKIPPLNPSWRIFFKPFHSIVWSLMLLSIIMVYLVYSLSIYIQKDTKYKFKNFLQYEPIENIGKIFFEQDASISSAQSRMSTRTLIFFWIYFSLILGTCYKSKLYNFLSFPTHSRVPTTHQELAESDFKIFFKSYRGVAIQMLEKSKDQIPFHKTIWNKMSIIFTTHECANFLFTVENSACLDYEVNLEFVIASNTSIDPNEDPMKYFKKSTDKIAPTFYGIFPVAKGSPLRSILSTSISRLKSHHILDILMAQDRSHSMRSGSKWLRSQKDNPVTQKLLEAQKERDVTARPLSSKALEATFFIYLMGICLTAFLFLGERFASQVVYPLSGSQMGSRIIPRITIDEYIV